MAKKVLLKDAATLLNGRAYKQDELLDSGKYPVLRVGKARPFHTTFNRQLHTVQALYGKQLRIQRFTRDELMQDLRPLLEYYASRDRGLIADRVCDTIIMRQKGL